MSEQTKSNCSASPASSDLLSDALTFLGNVVQMTREAKKIWQRRAGAEGDSKGKQLQNRALREPLKDCSIWYVKQMPKDFKRVMQSTSQWPTAWDCQPYSLETQAIQTSVCTLRNVRWPPPQSLITNRNQTLSVKNLIKSPSSLSKLQAMVYSNFVIV